MDTASSCLIRYRATFNNATGRYSQTTRNTQSPISPTAGGGLSCFVGGMTPSLYNASGCEQFGVSLSGSATPTGTEYYWLVGSKVSVGTLVRASAKVAIPAVNWSVNPNPVVGANPIVKASIEIEDFENETHTCDLYGDAKWVKVYVTEVEIELELHDLFDDNPHVPHRSNETEIEWELLQRHPTCGEHGESHEVNELELENEHDDDSHSVVRLYEFYEYTGEYDPETHKALDHNRWRDLNNRELGSNKVQFGNYLGSQTAALVFTQASTQRPTKRPWSKFSKKPTRRPSIKRTTKPSRRPSFKKTKKPSRLPSRKPSKPKPTRKPTKRPWMRKTKAPTKKP